MKSDNKKTADEEVAAATGKSNKHLYAIVGVILIAILAVGGYWWMTKKVDYTTAPVGNAKSPTEAYKMLYGAVKSKDPAKIKQMMSENSLTFAEFVGGQQKKSVEEVVVNGFTATTFAETLPQMRDERIKDNFGALEVMNPQTKQWEDLPFIREESGWKLAIGDMFKGSYVKPSEGQAIREQVAANAVNNNLIEIKPDANVNANNANVQMIIPKNSAAVNKNIPNVQNVPNIPKMNNAANVNK